jgi:hypothetical protein
MRKTAEVLDRLEDCGFSMMSHTVYSPDLVPCDFFLFQYLEQNLAGPSRVRAILAGISGGLLVSALAECVRRPGIGRHISGEYDE